MGPGELKNIPRNLLLPSSVAVCALLRERREALGWSLATLEKNSGISRQMLSFIEKNSRSPGLDIFSRIGVALEVQPSLLLHAAEQEVLSWPNCSVGCNYCCIVDGRPSCWNPERGCYRSRR